MKHIELSSGEYAAKWGLTDFYDDCEAKLYDAVQSGEDFMTDWGCKKEIRYASVRRENGVVYVAVTAHMDDLYDEDDLIYDALWARLRLEEELPDELIDSIREAACEMCMDDFASCCAELSGSATFSEIVEKIAQLENDAEALNTATFDGLCDLVEDYYRLFKGVSE